MQNLSVFHALTRAAAYAIYIKSPYGYNNCNCYFAWFMSNINTLEENNMARNYKIASIITNALLAFWFFFDMYGLQIGDILLVESAWKDIDGIWYLIYLVLFALFLLQARYGKYPLAAFLSIWLVIEFFSHWYYTIFGATQEKIADYNELFGSTYRIIPPSDTILIPDLFHIVLHILILAALIPTLLFCVKDKKARRT